MKWVGTNLSPSWIFSWVIPPPTGADIKIGFARLIASCCHVDVVETNAMEVYTFFSAPLTYEARRRHCWHEKTLSWHEVTLELLYSSSWVNIVNSLSVVPRARLVQHLLTTLNRSIYAVALLWFRPRPLQRTHLDYIFVDTAFAAFTQKKMTAVAVPLLQTTPRASHCFCSRVSRLPNPEDSRCWLKISAFFQNKVCLGFTLPPLFLPQFFPRLLSEGFSHTDHNVKKI